MRSFSLSIFHSNNKINKLYENVIFLRQKVGGLALFYVLVMMTAGGRIMKTFLALFALVLLLLPVCLTGCLRDDGLDNVKVDGEMSTVFRTGSDASYAGSRTRTGISF